MQLIGIEAVVQMRSELQRANSCSSSERTRQGNLDTYRLIRWGEIERQCEVGIAAHWENVVFHLDARTRNFIGMKTRSGKMVSVPALLGRDRRVEMKRGWSPLQQTAVQMSVVNNPRDIVPVRRSAVHPSDADSAAAIILYWLRVVISTGA
jgi:hypothetical protein